MVKSAVRVVVRLRPSQNFAQDVLQLQPDKKTILVHQDKDGSKGVVNNQQENWSFRFDQVLDNASQDTVYEECGRGIVQNVLNGFNGTIMAYGQTGAGKTFTMMGGTASYKYRGIAPRSIAQIFQEVAAKPEYQVVVRVSFLEIYNETMYDLLASVPSEAQNLSKELLICEDTRGGAFVKGLSEHIADSEEDALNLLFEGETNRAVADHQLNNASTRSHCVFIVQLETRSRVESRDSLMISKLNLVDLAGSERIGKTGSEGRTLKEANYINKSLSFLEQCIVALTSKNRDHIPYRQTKLTNVLRDSLGGNCKTLMIANIYGEKAHMEETISTLKFASRMMRVSNEAVQNIREDPHMLIKRYEAEIKELKQELAMYDTLNNRSVQQYEPFTEEQRFQLRTQVKDYLDDKEEEIPVHNLRHIKEIFMQFKVILKNTADEVESRLLAKYELREKGEGEAKGPSPTGGEDGVGDLVDRKGFSLGEAPTGAKPLDGGQSFMESTIEAQDDGEVEEGEEGAKKPVEKMTIPTRNEAYEEFKKTDGAEANNILKENQATLKEKKRLSREYASKVNQSKKAIDKITAQLQLKKEERESRGAAEDEDVIDEEEYALIKRLKENKKFYRDAYDELRVVKSEIEYINRLVDQCKQRLLMEFDDWFGQTYGAQEGNMASVQETTVREDNEVLDDAEKFDKMEMERIMQDDPDSLAFYKARKNTIHNIKVKDKGFKNSAAESKTGRTVKPTVSKTATLNR